MGQDFLDIQYYDYIRYRVSIICCLTFILNNYYQEHQISPGDFPDIKKMQEQLVNHDFTKFHNLGRPSIGSLFQIWLKSLLVIGSFQNRPEILSCNWSRSVCKPVCNFLDCKLIDRVEKILAEDIV